MSHSGGVAILGIEGETSVSSTLSVGGAPNGAGVPASRGPFDVVVVGASFGGPRAIEQIVSKLPEGFPVPIIVCQHISEGMTGMWSERLAGSCPLEVCEASDGAMLQPGTVYIAPTGSEAVLKNSRSGLRLALQEANPHSLHAPSIDGLFSSAAQELGCRALAVLLTGMGRDGAEGMLSVRMSGGYTIAESVATADSHSMPGAAVDLGAVIEELPRTRIASRLAELAAIGR